MIFNLCLNYFILNKMKKKILIINVYINIFFIFINFKLIIKLKNIRIIKYNSKNLKKIIIIIN